MGNPVQLLDSENRVLALQLTRLRQQFVEIQDALGAALLRLGECPGEGKCPRVAPLWPPDCIHQVVRDALAMKRLQKTDLDAIERERKPMR